MEEAQVRREVTGPGGVVEAEERRGVDDVNARPQHEEDEKNGVAWGQGARALACLLVGAVVGVVLGATAEADGIERAAYF